MGRSHEQQEKLKSLRSGFRNLYLLLQVPEPDISVELSLVKEVGATSQRLLEGLL